MILRAFGKTYRWVDSSFGRRDRGEVYLGTGGKLPRSSSLGTKKN